MMMMLITLIMILLIIVILLIIIRIILNTILIHVLLTKHIRLSNVIAYDITYKMITYYGFYCTVL